MSDINETTPEIDDTEGHRHLLAVEPEDDTEGHRHLTMAVEDEDDTEGHAIRL